MASGKLKQLFVDRCDNVSQSGDLSLWSQLRLIQILHSLLQKERIVQVLLRIAYDINEEKFFFPLKEKRLIYSLTLDSQLLPPVSSDRIGKAAAAAVFKVRKRSQLRLSKWAAGKWGLIWCIFTASRRDLSWPVERGEAKSPANQKKSGTYFTECRAQYCGFDQLGCRDRRRWLRWRWLDLKSDWTGWTWPG